MTATQSARELTPVSDSDHVALSRLVSEFAWRIDNLKAATLHELVTDDAELRTGADPVIGIDAIKAWGAHFDETDPLPGIRHSITNARFSGDGPDRAQGTSMLTAYWTAPGEDAVTTPFAVGEDHDTFIRTPDGWRLASRVWVQLFTR